MKPHASLREVDAELLAPFFKKIHSKADRITGSFLIGFFITGVALSFFHETYLLAFAMGGVSIAIFFIVRSIAPGSNILRLVAGFLYWNFGLQFLIQMQGLTEMRFVFFIALTVLLFYEDWSVFFLPTLYALGCISFAYAFRDTELMSHYLPNAGEMTLTSFVLQIFLMTFFAGLCMWWAASQHHQTRDSALSALRMEDQLKMVDVNISFADSISNGSLNSVYGSDEPDRLGHSLLNMRNSLLDAAQREDREKFAAVGIGRIGEILRANADNLNSLCDKVVEEVVRYMKANQGSIFVKEEHENGDAVLHLMAARAWERKKFHQKSVDIGHGLIGQATLEKRSIFMTKVPDNYVTITSGLGNASPSCILIVPLKSEEEVVGVIELASFRVYEEFEIKFLEKVGESIASTILTTKNNQQNKELLEKSNVLAEQMRAQEEEIRQNMEEMQATQEEMQRKNNEIERLLQDANNKEQQLQIKLKEIQEVKDASDQRNAGMMEHMEGYRKTLLDILDQLPHKIFLKDDEGRMVLVNTVVAKAHNMTVEELMGKSDFDFVDAKTAQEWRNQELEIIKKGSETYIFNETLHGETKTLKSTKMAFYIPHLKQTGLLGIQTDITELQQLRDAAREVRV